MPVSASTLKKLMDAGLTGDALVDVVASIDADMAESTNTSHSSRTTEAHENAKASARSRTRRYRDRRKKLGMPAAFQGELYWDALVARDGDKCVYCQNADAEQVDHILPISKGGTDDLGNLALACRPCNGGKSGRYLGNGYELSSAKAVEAHEKYMMSREQSREQSRGDVKGASPSLPSPTPPTNSTPPPKEKPPTGSKRKSRLPDGFPDDEAKQTAIRYWREKGRDDLVGDVDTIADAFAGYHEGKGTLAMSWGGTWRTWYAGEARKAPMRRQGFSPKTVTGQSLSKSDELKRRLVRLRDDGVWLSDWGIPPFARDGVRDDAFATLNGGWREVDAVFGADHGVADLLTAAGGGR